MGGLDWITLAQDSGKWLAVVNKCSEFKNRLRKY
jgi:hypothetical protein